jgi:hypothetical protein
MAPGGREETVSATQYALNLGLLAFVLWTNLGTRALAPARLLLPLVVVAGVAAGFLGHVPTVGGDVALEATLTVAGLVLGAGAGLLVRVDDGPTGPVMRAGAAYAALWILVIGGRMAFAYGADHWFTRQLVTFSIEHRITGADAWTAGFVLMALAMVVTRVAVTAARSATLARRPVEVPA